MHFSEICPAWVRLWVLASAPCFGPFWATLRGHGARGVPPSEGRRPRRRTRTGDCNAGRYRRRSRNADQAQGTSRPGRAGSPAATAGRPGAEAEARLDLVGRGAQSRRSRYSTRLPSASAERRHGRSVEHPRVGGTGAWSSDSRTTRPWMWTSWTTIERRGTAIMAMLNPCHPGEILRDNLEAAELSVTEAASRLGCTRQALSPAVEREGRDFARRWHWRWRGSAGATRASGCGCRRATSLRKRAGIGLPPNGARARCTHNRIQRSRCRTGNCPACRRSSALKQRQAVRLRPSSGESGRG